MAAKQEAFIRDILIPYKGQECLIWPFTRNSNGYGFLYRNSRRRLAHRFSCELAHGEPPTAKHEAAHSCGNGHLGCVAPNHLSWKTRAENAADAKVHGTAPIGEKHGCAVLAERDVRIIRHLRGRIGQRKIAAAFGVSPSTIAHIHTGRLWKHLNEDASLEDLAREASELAARVAERKATT